MNLSAAMTTSNSSGYTGSAYANVWYSAQFMAPIYPVWLKDASGKDLLDELGNKQLDYGKVRPTLNDFSCVGTLYDDKFRNTETTSVPVRSWPLVLTRTAPVS